MVAAPAWGQPPEFVQRVVSRARLASREPAVTTSDQPPSDRPPSDQSQPPAGSSGLRRRDRRGRGIRGPLAPPSVPLSRTRAEAFDELVLDAVEHLEPRWGSQLENVQFAVEDVPPAALLSRGRLEPVPLGAWFAATATTPAQVVIYRRPIEARSTGLEEVAELVHDVVVEEIAELFGLDPEAVDPGYGEGWDGGPEGE